MLPQLIDNSINVIAIINHSCYAGANLVILIANNQISIEAQMVHNDLAYDKIDIADIYMLDLCTDYLICSFGATTATRLSVLTDGAVSLDKVTRFLSSDLFTSADLWKLVKPTVHKIQSTDGVIIIDDSVEDKPYTDENELICWHFDHTKGETVKGINMVSTLYHSNGISVPVAFELIKNEYYRQMLYTNLACA